MRIRLSLIIIGALTVGVLGPIPSAQAATITVTSTGDDSPSAPADGDCTLREAVAAANSDAAVDACPAGSGADVVLLSAGTFTLTVAGAPENLGASGDLDITTALTIRGAGPALTTVDAAGNERGFHTPFTASPPAVEISGMTITGGNVPTTGGGAIFNQGAALSLSNVVLTGNRSEYGGGIANDDPASLTVMNSLIAGNIGADDDVGGGVDLDGVVSSFTNVTVSGNRAQEGGGLWISGGSSTLNNVTVTGNTATNGGFGGGIQAFAAVTLRNSIVAGNGLIEGSQDPDCDGSITSDGYNVIGNNTGCTFLATTGDKVGTGAAPIDPLLGPLADNGGPTGTHALLSGSPAIDAGNPAAAGSGGTACAAADQRGAPRSVCDIGAYELTFCQTAVVNRVGTPGNDVLVGTAGPDGVLALGGNDKAKGVGGSDRLCLGEGNDTGTGGGGKDRLLGELGKDRLKGQGGNDRLRGGPGKDTCVGGPGKRDKAACEVERQVP